MNHATVILSIALSTVVLIVPRRSIMIPLIIAACLVPMNQRIVITGLDFTVLRILVLACMLRLLARGEIKLMVWNSFDMLILVWIFSGTLAYIVLWGPSAIIYKCGIMYDSLGLYWIFRQVIRSFNDIYYIIKLFAILTIISAPLIVAEKIRESSFYEIFGTVGASFHRGRFRCAGPFPHYIMMGCFWASLLPLFYAQLKTNKNNVLYKLGIISALSSVYLSASSTPLMTIIAMFLLWQLYPYRVHGKRFFYLFLSFLAILHLIMNNPVWHLMARVNIFGGSTGWHRFHIFDEFIKHWTEWFLFGSKETGHWGYGLDDVTNQYVLEAVRGGFVTLVVFILILYKTVKIPGVFSLLGNSNMWLSWGICVASMGHIVTFWGVSYFGQITMLLYLHFAIVGFMQEQYSKEKI